MNYDEMYDDEMEKDIEYLFPRDISDEVRWYSAISWQSCCWRQIAVTSLNSGVIGKNTARLSIRNILG